MAQKSPAFLLEYSSGHGTPGAKVCQITLFMRGENSLYEKA